MRETAIEALANHGFRLAERCLLAHGALPGLVVGYRAGAVRAALPLEWTDLDDRSRKLARIREVFDAIGVDRYYVVEEIWTFAPGASASGDPGWTPDKGLRVIAADRDGANAVRVGAVERDDTGKPCRIVAKPAIAADESVDDLTDLASPAEPVLAWYVPH
jgi:hypothetical protein